MKNINQIEFKDISVKEDSIIIDVRRPDECARGVVPNARIIDFSDQRNFTSEIQKLDKAKHYLVYCRSGNRSSRACMMMASIGIENTYNLNGGMMSWRGEVE